MTEVIFMVVLFLSGVFLLAYVSFGIVYGSVTTVLAFFLICAVLKGAEITKKLHALYDHLVQ